MGISLKTQKMLWGRAASICAFTDCKKELVMDATETDDESLVGEACHIVARSEDGPRGKSDLNAEQRDKYNNLILLCNVHHKLIDDQENEYTIEKLNTIKNEHITWVKSKLQTYDKKSQREDEVYSSYIEQFEKLIDVDNWNAWTSYLVSHGQPSIYNEPKEKLEELRTWLLNRVWPKRYSELELAFENFRRVLIDLLNKFSEHAEKWGDDAYITKKFYRLADPESERERELFKNWEMHCYLVHDLTAELTRAANYIFDMVREYVMPSYRLDEGVLLLTSGPNELFQFTTRKHEYKSEERTSIPYLGLDSFYREQRFYRDYCFGTIEEVSDTPMT